MPISAEILQKLQDPHHQMTGLDLAHSELTDADAAILSELLVANPSIRELQLQGNELTDVGIAALAPALARLPKLLILHLDTNQIGPKGAKQLAKHFAGNHNLTTLSLQGNQIGDEGIAALAPVVAAMPRMQYFNLAANRLTAAGEKIYADAFFRVGHTSLITAATGCAALQAFADANKQYATEIEQRLVSTLPQHHTIRDVCDAHQRASPMWAVRLQKQLGNDTTMMDVYTQRLREAYEALPTIALEELTCFDDLLEQGRCQYGPRAKGEMPESLRQLTPLDNPATWENFTAIAEHLETLGHPITKEDLLCTNRDGDTYLENGIRSGALKQIMSALFAQGEHFAPEELVDAEGKPTPILQAAIDARDVGPLFQPKNWVGRSMHEALRIKDVLPEPEQAQVPVHALAHYLGREKQTMQQGRG